MLAGRVIDNEDWNIGVVIVDTGKKEIFLNIDDKMKKKIRPPLKINELVEVTGLLEISGEKTVHTVISLRIIPADEYKGGSYSPSDS